MQIGVIGSGTMGAGIAQVAATNNHKTFLFDISETAIEKAKIQHEKILNRLVEKEKITAEQKDNIQQNLVYTSTLSDLFECGFIIEAIIEKLEVKQSLFKDLEAGVSTSCILASNTSSLSIASIGSALNHPERAIGIHFFNPAPLMPLVEIIPSVATAKEVLTQSTDIIKSWKKVAVQVKDTPGFIVNRVARPFYGEALRIAEEGIADYATIDWAMKELGGFRMGPFELMDYIGNDINYTVTETVFSAFYFDPRYKPSFTQKRLMEAKMLGRKSGKGYYNYAENAANPTPNTDPVLGKTILNRILAMLINEAADALFLNVASKEDIDLAMTNGVNYPKGLLKWADELGIAFVLQQLEDLQEMYGEDRYRPSYLLKKMNKENQLFY